MEPLGTRKQRRDGDEEKTHLCIRLAPGQQRYLQTLKDPYSFDFLTMRDDYDEKELEDALVNQITQFLLELGTGFPMWGVRCIYRLESVNFILICCFIT